MPVVALGCADRASVRTRLALHGGTAGLRWPPCGAVDPHFACASSGSWRMQAGSVMWPLCRSRLARTQGHSNSHSIKRLAIFRQIDTWPSPSIDTDARQPPNPGPLEEGRTAADLLENPYGPNRSSVPAGRSSRANPLQLQLDLTHVMGMNQAAAAVLERLQHRGAQICTVAKSGKSTRRTGPGAMRINGTRLGSGG